MEKNRKKYIYMYVYIYICMYVYIYIYLNHFAIQWKFAQHVNQLCLDCLVAKLCLALCNRMDCSPPVSSIHGISQARILEWVAISLSKGSF